MISFLIGKRNWQTNEKIKTHLSLVYQLSINILIEKTETDKCVFIEQFKLESYIYI